MSRSRLALDVHEAVFARVLELLAGHGLVKGGRIGVIWLRYAIGDQNVVLLGCLRLIDGPKRAAILGIRPALFIR